MICLNCPHDAHESLTCSGLLVYDRPGGVPGIQQCFCGHHIILQSGCAAPEIFIPIQRDVDASTARPSHDCGAGIVKAVAEERQRCIDLCLEQYTYWRDMSQVNTHVKARIEAEEKLATAMALLARATELQADSPVKNDPKFWKDLYLFTGQHMILTDEGWEDGAAKQSYIDMLKDERYTLDDLILDEVNAPV